MVAALVTMVVILAAISVGAVAWAVRAGRSGPSGGTIAEDANVAVDALTGLGSRRGFEQYLARRGDHGGCALVMVDIDHFRGVNDELGGPGADDVLREVARMLEHAAVSTCDERARLWRLGGDDFAIVIDGSDTMHALTVVEWARSTVAELARVALGVPQMGLSCGVACAPEHGETLAEVVGYAGRALYHAKRSGRDRTVVYAPTMFDAAAASESRDVLHILADVLAAAVDAKDAYTHAHSRNVSDLSLYLARAMGLDEGQVADIALGGLLHDIGKIGVSDHVLKKPGRLDAEEWEEIKTHCDIGYAMLSSIGGAEHIREMVLYHHERPDGTGYPRGLVGAEIPLAARIIGVADAFDSMTAERVYSEPRSPEEAIDEIVRLKGRQFDPHVVDALCELLVYDAPEAHVEGHDEGGHGQQSLAA